MQSKQFRRSISRALYILLPALILSTLLVDCSKEEEEITSFRFTATADNRDLHQKWRYVLEQIKTNHGDEGAFHLSAGDYDTVDSTYANLQKAFGDDVLFYACVGNHELPGETSTSNERPDENMPWLKTHNSSLPYIVKWGPEGCEETTYSYNYGPAHFVVLNQYYDGQSDDALDGDICDALFDWLKADLDANSKPIIFVIGHEAAYPSSKDHHATDCINKYPERRDRFWNLLVEKKVAAHFTAHTHHYLRGMYDGVWEINLGNAGQNNFWLPTDPDTQTYLDVQVETNKVIFTAYSGIEGDDFTEDQDQFEFVVGENN